MTLLFKFKISTCEIVEEMLLLAVGKEGEGEGGETDVGDRNRQGGMCEGGVSNC